MPNYNYVADMSFRPFSFQEMMAPLAIYKEEYDKIENAYDELTQKADMFKYLANQTEDNPQAKAIYEGYANELAKNADDLQKNGLNIANRRALMNMRRRYQGEIGQLERADAALQEERKRRRDNKDLSMLYAEDNLKIDQFLGDKNPNLYSVSGEDLYKRGAQAAASASSRIYDDTRVKNITKYYQEMIQRVGYSPELVAAFRQDLSAIPELQDVVEGVLEEKGVNANLTGDNYNRARQSIINGIADGALYKESRNVHQNPGVMTAAQAASNARQIEAGRRADKQMALTAAQHGFEYDPNTGTYVDKNEWMYEHDENGNRIGLNPEAYNQDDYEIDPNTGKLKKKTRTSNYSKTPEEKEEEKAAGALLALNKTPKVFKNNNGFNVTVGTENRHYTYAGALSTHGGKWARGTIGSDVPGRGWGFTSASNVMSPWGNYSAESIDKSELDKVRLLAENEIVALQNEDPEFNKALADQIEEYAKAHGIPDNKPIDWQVIEVPNESGGSRKGYLIAVRDI